MRRVGILGVLIAIVAMLGGGVMWLASRRPIERKWTLPDGTELTFLRVTYGPKHEARYGNSWQDYLAPILPAKLRTRLGSRVATYKPTDTNAIVVWMRENSSGPPNLAWTLSQAILTIGDRSGLEAGHEYSKFNMATPRTNGMSVHNWEMLNFPRRSAELRIVIYARKNPNAGWELIRVGEFMVPNPARRTAVQEWTPETLPARRMTNGLEISLLKLWTGITEAEGGMGFGSQDAKISSRAVFDLRENGRKMTNWTVAKIHPSAATGEIAEPGSYGGGWEGEGFVFRFQSALWLEEPAWKVRVELWRTADFPAEELWTVKGVAVPAPKQITEVHAKTNIYGAEVELQGVVPQGMTQPRSWGLVGAGNMGDMGLHVCLSSFPADVHLTLVRVTDDQGRAVNDFGGSTSSTDGTNRMDFGFGLRLPDGAKTLDVTLAVSKSLSAEFLAKPKLYKSESR